MLANLGRLRRDCGGTSAASGEIEHLHEGMLAAQANENRSAQPSQHLDLRRCIKVVFEYAGAVTEESKANAAKVTALRSAAKKAQGAMQAAEAAGAGSLRLQREVALASDGKKRMSPSLMPSGMTELELQGRPRLVGQAVLKTPPVSLKRAS